MDIAFIADPLDDFKIYKDSTFAMMRALQGKGHRLFATLLQDLARTAEGTVEARWTPVELTGEAIDWYRAGDAVNRELVSFDAVIMRKDPPFDLEYVYATYLLELAERQGARVFNRPRAIRDHNEKLAITEFGQFIAPTVVTRNAERIRAFHQVHGDIILKPLDGMGGMGIFRVRQDELNLGSIIETLTALGTRTIMVQRYIPEIVDGDKRILLINGKPIPYALARVPQGKEVRGNLAAGGIGRAQPLSKRDLAIASTLGPVLAARGLLVVGLDCIGEFLTEINVTSPTCFQEITEQTGFDVAQRFAEELEGLLAAEGRRT